MTQIILYYKVAKKSKIYSFLNPRVLAILCLASLKQYNSVSFGAITKEKTIFPFSEYSLHYDIKISSKVKWYFDPLSLLSLPAQTKGFQCA